MSDVEETQVRKRKVFVLPGHDPISPQHHVQVYEGESAKQGEVSEFDLRVWRKKGAASYGWLAHMDIDDVNVESDFELMVWNDLVQDTMSRTPFGSYLKLIKTAWIYTTSGAARQMMSLRKAPVLLSMYPMIMLILQLLAAVVLTVVIAEIVREALAWSMSGGVWLLMTLELGDGERIEDFTVFAMIMQATAIAIVICVFVRILNWFKAKDHFFFAHYLMHEFAFFARKSGQYSDALEERLAQFGAQIGAALADDAVDEVLVVAHSSGVHLGVSVLADVVRAQQVRPDGPALGLVTLGHITPVVSFLPKAERLRGDLSLLSGCVDITWVDISAPADPTCFALVDPVSVSGVAAVGAQWPLTVPLSYTQVLAPSTWQDIQWRLFRLHFQYMCAFENPGHYDYFQITAGPRTLAARYDGYASTPSRIDTATSRHTSMVGGALGSPAIPAE